MSSTAPDLIQFAQEQQRPVGEDWLRFARAAASLAVDDITAILDGTRDYGSAFDDAHERLLRAADHIERARTHAQAEAAKEPTR